MKKIIIAIAVLAVAALALSCEKIPEPKIQKRLTLCGDQWDKYAFTYGADGKLTLVNRNEGERTWTFTWSGNVGTAKYVKDKEEKGNWTFTLGDNGYLSSLSNEWGDTWGFTYNSESYLTKIVRTDKDNAVKANCVWANGDLTKWSRIKDDNSEEWKIQSFLEDENVAGIFAEAARLLQSTPMRRTMTASSPKSIKFTMVVIPKSMSTPGKSCRSNLPALPQNQGARLRSLTPFSICVLALK